MKVLRFLDDRTEEIIVVTCLGIMTVVIGLQVFMRYVMQDSLSWSEELARYLFIFFIYAGISYGVKMRRHIRVEAFTMWMPARVQAVIKIIAQILFMAFAVIVIYYGYETSTRIFKLKQVSAALDLPMGYVYATLPFCYVMVAIRLLQQFPQLIADIFGKKKEEEK